MRNFPERAGGLLADAWRSGSKIADLADARPRNWDEAYGIQDALVASLGLPVAGWKVGAATEAIMAERGLDAPIPGPVYRPRTYTSPAHLPATDFPTAQLESEFAFRTLTRIAPRRARYEPEELVEASAVHGALDLTQTRYSVPPDPLLEIADSGNSGGAVIGPEVVDWRNRDLPQANIELRIDGGSPVKTYSGARRRDPLDVLTWLVNSLMRRGIGLPAGSFVLTGSVTEPQPLRPGNYATACFEGAGEVRVHVEEFPCRT